MVASAGSLVFDFENSELDGWKVVEGSFQKLHTDRKDFHHNKGPYNKHGDWFLSTLETVSGQPSDTMRGVIESPVFTLDSPKIMLLVGGGKHAETYVALCTLDGKAHYFGRGESSQKMRNVTWDAEGLVGKKVFLRMVDDHVAGWGHITLDHVQCEGSVDAVATEAHRKARKSVLGKATPQVGPRQISATGIRHSFLTTGSWTAIVGEDNEVIWEVGIAPAMVRFGKWECVDCVCQGRTRVHVKARLFFSTNWRPVIRKSVRHIVCKMEIHLWRSLVQIRVYWRSHLKAKLRSSFAEA